MGILLLLPTCLWANPTGGNVAAGAAQIAGQGTSAVTINQTSNIAIINWQSFSINSGESTTFLQPSVTSAALNRVLGGQTSLINGTLSANGQIYLINGNGVIVGPGGTINASAFTASTRDITDADFLSGNLHFFGSNNAGVQNRGRINAIGGDVVLIGRTVDNEGTITVPKGTAGLVAGDDVLLAQKNADGSMITVSPKTTATSASGQVGVNNSGSITAAAAELKAANGNIYALAVQNQGTIRATTISHQGGRIWLTSDSGAVSNSGTLNASATAVGGHGGTVTLKSATGAASHTGQIIAQGGAGGAGGNAEVSGAQVQFTGKVDLTAPQGTTGTLLIDPATIDIITGGGTDITASTIDPSTIVTALNSASVVLTGTTSITVDSLLDASANTNAGNLTLSTPVLNLNASINLNGSLFGASGTVNVGAGGFIQNAIDTVNPSAFVNLSPATYALSNEVVINKNVFIRGNGAILNGQGVTRVMEIDGSASVAMTNLTMTGGNGVSAAGAAGASWNFDGGALLVFGVGSTKTENISTCTFSGNSANSGGAIFSVSISGGSNSISIIDSTITGNSAINGSALYNYGSFGGSASMGLTQVTLAGNSGTGAIYNTILSAATASVSISDTILAGNTDFSGESDYVINGAATLVDGGHNLYGQNGNAGGFVPGSTGAATDILLGGGIATALGPLGNYGGFTQTLPLVAGSPAIDAGNSAYIGQPDQRGVTRGSPASYTSSGADIGAFEAQFISVQADPISIIYGQTPTFTYTITNGPAVASASLTGAPALFTGATNVGSYPGDIQIGTLMSTPLFILNFTAGDFTITPRIVVVDPDAGQSKIYGTPDPALTYTTAAADTTTGLVNGDTLTGSPSYTGAGQFTNVGNYATNLGDLFNSNYTVALSAVAPTFAITPRALTVSAIDLTGTPSAYGTTPAFANDGQSQTVNGDILGGTVSYTQTDGLSAGGYLNAGTYSYTPLITGAVNSNYTISGYTPAAFQINAGTLKYTATPATRLGGVTNPVFGGTITGFLAGETMANATTGALIFTSPATPMSLMGGYAINGSGLTSDFGNYGFVQALGNATALTITTSPPPSTSPNVPPASQPNTTVSQAIAQTSPTVPPPSGGSNAPVLPPTVVPVDITLNSISPNESIDSSPGGDSSSSGSDGGGDLAQGSSFDQGSSSPANVVAVGQTVTLGGGAGNTPPPPAVQAELTQVLGTQSLDTLTGALSAITTADDQGASAPGAPDQGNAAAGGGSANPNGPGSSGSVTEVAPGQTVTLSGGKSANLPPPAPVQAAFDQGFSPQSLTTLTSAAFAGGASANPSNQNPAGAVTTVAPGQTVTLSGGKSASSPPPAPVQAAFDQGFSPQSRDTLSKAAGQ